MSEPPSYRGQRIQLILGKYPVTRVIKTPAGFDFRLKLAGDFYFIVSAPGYVDVREGDLLTLYAEVAYAKPSQPSIK